MIECFTLFAIKNRYKISLYKYTREMQHVVNPAPVWRARDCSGVTNIWKDIIIQRNSVFTWTLIMQLQPQLSRENNFTRLSISDWKPPGCSPLFWVTVACEHFQTYSSPLILPHINWTLWSFPLRVYIHSFSPKHIVCISEAISFLKFT